MGATCCFFGHRDIFDNVEDFLYTKISYLIENENVTEFLVGDHGDFDKSAASAVRKAKLNYSNIKLTLVRPYFSEELNTNKDFMSYQKYFIFTPHPIPLPYPSSLGEGFIQTLSHYVTAPFRKKN